MRTWEAFEIECTQYLNTTFGQYATFVRQGGSDSTKPDILVRTRKGNSFFIDVKDCPAQCGQFVLLPDMQNRTFVYSRLNVSQNNTYVQHIINHMNENFEDFKEAGTSGKQITLESGEDIFTNWIIHTYMTHNVKYFITNNYTIVPIQDFKKYFNVTATYRIKRSGSASAGKSNTKNLLNHIASCNYVISDYQVDNDKLFIQYPSDIHNERFIYQSYEYMFSKRDTHQYEVRKLSNTFNANVIFSITNKSGQGLSNQQFIKELE